MQERKETQASGLAALDRRQRLQITLGGLAAWHVIGAFLPLLGGSFLIDVSGGQQIEGILGGRIFNAESVVLAVLYAQAARNPEQHRFLVLLAVIQQLAAIGTMALVLGQDLIDLSAVVAPIIVSGAFLVGLLLWYPEKPGSGGVVPR